MNTKSALATAKRDERAYSTFSVPTIALQGQAHANLWPRPTVTVT